MGSKKNKQKNKLPDIINQNTRSDFALVPLELIRSNEISGKAFKVLCIIRSNKKGWYSYLSHIDNLTKEGTTSVKTALKELEELGYLLRIRYRDSKNAKLAGTLWLCVDEAFSFDLDDAYQKIKDADLHPVTLDNSTVQKSTCRNSSCRKVSTKYINSKKKINFKKKEKNTKKKVSNPPNKYFKLAKKLSEIIQTKKDITHPKTQLNQWAVEFKRLEKDNKISTTRQKEVLKWYATSIGGEYVPVVESGSAFRSKFTNLEAAIERDKNPNNNSTPTRTSGYRRKDGHQYKEATIQV